MIQYLPGLEPITFYGDLTRYNHIVLSISGGKDSHAMMYHVTEMAEKQNVKNNLIAVYADTGMEWHNAESHVKHICQIAEIPLVIVAPNIGLIDKMQVQIEKYDTVKFPSPRCRYCTRQHKVHPMDKHIRTLKGRILQVTGERRDESRSRARLPDYGIRYDLCSRKRTVEGWRPMLEFETPDIFAKIKEGGIEPHPVYELGGSRLGCAGCIFSNDNDLKIEMRENPHIFERLDKLEIDSGFTMSMDKIRIRDRIKEA